MQPLFFSVYNKPRIHKRNVILLLTCFFILGVWWGGVLWFCWFSSWDPRLNSWQLVSPIQSNPSPDWFIYVYPNPTWEETVGYTVPFGLFLHLIRFCALPSIHSSSLVYLVLTHWPETKVSITPKLLYCNLQMQNPSNLNLIDWSSNFYMFRIHQLRFLSFQFSGIYMKVSGPKLEEWLKGGHIVRDKPIVASKKWSFKIKVHDINT